MHPAFTARALLVASAFGLAGCGPKAERSLSQVQSADAWPRCLAGRHLQVETQHYALYANDPAEATALADWVDAELAEFRSWARAEPFGKGLVVAIESDEEPAGTLPNQRCVAAAGSYCFSQAPYFRESFSVPNNGAIHRGALGNRCPPPAWLCFLTADRYAAECSRACVQRNRKHLLKALSEPPPLVVLLSLPALPLLYFEMEFIAAAWKTIDGKLMRLQRREVLWATLISCAVNDPKHRNNLVGRLREETGTRWNDIWSRRPID